jgi:hypothetical protein
VGAVGAVCPHAHPRPPHQSTSSPALQPRGCCRPWAPGVSILFHPPLPHHECTFHLVCLHSRPTQQAYTAGVRLTACNCLPYLPYLPACRQHAGTRVLSCTCPILSAYQAAQGLLPTVEPTSEGIMHVRRRASSRRATLLYRTHAADPIISMFIVRLPTVVASCTKVSQRSSQTAAPPRGPTRRDPGVRALLSARGAHAKRSGCPRRSPIYSGPHSPPQGSASQETLAGGRARGAPPS